MRQYRRSEQWKRAEFVTAEMKEFFAGAKVSTAMTLIDWSGRNIRLLGLQDPENRDWTYVDRRMQCSRCPHTVIDSLHGSDREAEHSGAERAYPRAQTIIRDCFDAFFDGLERFGGNVQSGLVRAGVSTKTTQSVTSGMVVSHRSLSSSYKTRSYPGSSF